VLYLYAVTSRLAAELPELIGISAAPVTTIVARDLAAVVSPLDGRDVPTTVANLWQHEALLERLMERSSVLPVRFGTILRDEAQVRELLGTHHPRFVAALGRVQGRVEVGLRVLWDESALACGRPLDTGAWLGSNGVWQTPPASSPSTLGSPGRDGQAYLTIRREEERQALAWRRRAEALRMEIHPPLARLAAESTQQVLKTPRLPLTAAYLVDQERLPAFRATVQALAVAFPTLRFLCTGPWPPYSFVTECVPRPTFDGCTPPSAAPRSGAAITGSEGATA
jgi:hypothetical protein